MCPVIESIRPGVSCKYKSDARVGGEDVCSLAHVTVVGDVGIILQFHAVAIADTCRSCRATVCSVLGVGEEQDDISLVQRCWLLSIGIIIVTHTAVPACVSANDCHRNLSRFGDFYVSLLDVFFRERIPVNREYSEVGLQITIQFVLRD